MNNYIIYDSVTYEVKRTVSCPENMIDVQLDDGESFIDGTIDENTQKIVDGVISDMTEEEITNMELGKRTGTMPPVEGITDDEEFNLIISEYFFGTIDAQTWRIENYYDLRSMFYPDERIKLDADVKINSGDPDTIVEGNIQQAQYYADCLAVKARFPKEVSNGN